MVAATRQYCPTGRARRIRGEQRQPKGGHDDNSIQTTIRTRSSGDRRRWPLARISSRRRGRAGEDRRRAGRPGISRERRAPAPVTGDERRTAPRRKHGPGVVLGYPHQEHPRPRHRDDAGTLVRAAGRIRHRLLRALSHGRHGPDARQRRRGAGGGVSRVQHLPGGSVRALFRPYYARRNDPDAHAGRGDRRTRTRCRRTRVQGGHAEQHGRAIAPFESPDSACSAPNMAMKSQAKALLLYFISKQSTGMPHFS